MLGFDVLSCLDVFISFLDAWIGELDGMDVLKGFPLVSWSVVCLLCLIG